MQKVREKKIKNKKIYHAKKREEYAKRKATRKDKLKYNSLRGSKSDKKTFNIWFKNNEKRVQTLRDTDGFKKVYEQFSRKPRQLKVQLYQEVLFKERKTGKKLRDVLANDLEKSVLLVSSKDRYVTNILNTYNRFEPNGYHSLALQLGADPSNCGTSYEKDIYNNPFILIQGPGGTFKMTARYAQISPKGDQSVDDAFIIERV